MVSRRTTGTRYMLLIGAITAAASFAVGSRYISTLPVRLDTSISNPNPLIRQLAPTWRSMKKIADFPFVFWSSFPSHNLPVYELTITPQDLYLLLERLPRYPEEYYLSEEYKETAPAYFRHGDSASEVRVRFRGVSPQHWNAEKKSWHIVFPENLPFENASSLRLTIPEDRNWTAEFLNHRRAEAFGLLSPQMQFVWLRVNGENHGVYITIEGWGNEFLTRNNRPVGEIYSPRDIHIKNVDYLRAESLPLWEARISQTPASEQRHFLALLSLISNADDETFRKELPQLLDMEKFYDWAVVNMLAGSMHQGNIENMNFYFNPETKKFEVISFDVSLEELTLPFDTSTNRLLERVFAHDPWKAAIEERTRTYVGDLQNLEEDLAYLDRQTERIKNAVMKDTAKLPTTVEVLSQLRKNRELFMHNFSLLRSSL